jgi:hypothetical protein
MTDSPEYRPLVDTVAIDAARFRALATCPRIDMMGSAGVDPVTGALKYPDEPGSVHFGAKMFTVNDIGEKAETGTNWGRNCIIALVEDIGAVQGLPAFTTKVGESERDDALRFRLLVQCPRINLHAVRGASIANGAIGVHDAAGFAFSAEYWPSGQPHASKQCDPADGILCLTMLADILAAKAANPDMILPDAPAGEPTDATWLCRLATADAADLVEVVAPTRQEAAAEFALGVFHRQNGEWMGGTVVAMRDEDLMRLIDETGQDEEPLRWNCSVEFHEEEAFASAQPLAA